MKNNYSKILNEVLLNWGDKEIPDNNIISSKSIANKIKHYTFGSEEHKWCIGRAFDIFCEILDNDNLWHKYLYPYNYAGIRTSFFHNSCLIDSYELDEWKLSAILTFYKELQTANIFDFNEILLNPLNTIYLNPFEYFDFMTIFQDFPSKAEYPKKTIQGIYLYALDKDIRQHGGVQQIIKNYMDYADTEIFADNKTSIIEKIINDTIKYEDIQWDCFKTIASVNIDNINTTVNIKAMKVWNNSEKYYFYILVVPCNYEAYYTTSNSLNLFTNRTKNSWEFQPWYVMFPFVPFSPEI